MCLGHHLFLKILPIEYSALNFILNIALFRSVSGFNWVVHPLVLSIFWSLSHAVCIQNSPSCLHPPLPLPSASLFSVVVTWMLTGSTCALTLVHGSFAFSWPYLYFWRIYLNEQLRVCWVIPQLSDSAVAAWLAKAYFKLNCERIPLITVSLGVCGGGEWSKTTVKKSF